MDGYSGAESGSQTEINIRFFLSPLFDVHLESWLADRYDEAANRGRRSWTLTGASQSTQRHRFDVDGLPKLVAPSAGRIANQSHRHL